VYKKLFDRTAYRSGGPPLISIATAYIRIWGHQEGLGAKRAYRVRVKPTVFTTSSGMEKIVK
jgi:hypothetical protein